MKVNPYLNFAGDAEAALGFYKSIFGGEFSSVVRFKDMPVPGMQIPKEAEDKMMHIALPIAGDVVMASDTLESLGQKLNQGNNVYLSVHPDSKEEADRIFTALAADGAVEMPIADQPWGDYWGSLKDRFGALWMVDCSPPKK